METITLKNKTFLEIYPRDTAVGRGKILRKRRMLLGSSDSCDLRFNGASIDAIHAVIEINGHTGKIYDMDSTSGIFVNGKNVSVSEIQVGDLLQIGGHEFEIKVFDKSNVLPPPLQMLQGGVIEEKPKIAPFQQASSPSVQVPQVPQASQRIPQDFKEEFIPRVQYPLAQDPNAEFSEYIFEDVESLYPIFNYRPGLSSIEVIILFDGRIYSVDYIPVKDGAYRLVGYNPKNNEVEYASLGKKEKMEFISVQAGEVFVNLLPGYTTKSLDEDNQKIKSTVHLLEDDIVFFERDLVKIFIRRTEHPPKTKCAPIFRRDEGFKKYLTMILCFLLLFLGFISFLEIDPEKKKEKDPERIATILYKKRRFKIKKPAVTKQMPPEKTKNAPKNTAQKSPVQKKIEKKPTPKPVKKMAQKVGRKTPQPQKAKKAKPKKGPPNKIKQVTASNKSTVNKRSTPKKRPNPRRRPGPPKKRTPVKKIAASNKSIAKKVSRKRPGPRRKAAPSKARGSVDTYKAFNFKSTVSSLMAKGGGARSVKTSTYSSTIGSGGVAGSSASAQSQLASVSQNVGSLTGAASGKMAHSSGAEGLSSKRGIFTAGLPSNTVVLGGMDPDTIRQILVDHIPQFRGCYQNVLDRSSASFSGVGKFNFIIGSSGYVSKAGVGTGASVPSSIKRCVVNVLKGIKFPSPRGGGVVEVNQPFNFLANKA